MRIREIQQDARANGFRQRPLWPAIVLRTPKGWTGPKVVDGVQIEGTFRAHQVPVAAVRDNPEHLRILEEWMRSYKPEELFDAAGRFRAEYAGLAPRGARRMGANPHANGGELTVPLDLPDYVDYAVEVPKPATVRVESTRRLGELLRDVFRRNAQPANFRLFCPDETNSNRLGAVFEATDRCFVSTLLDLDEHVSHDGRVMEVLSEHNCHGGGHDHHTVRHGRVEPDEPHPPLPGRAEVHSQHGRARVRADRPRQPDARATPRLRQRALRRPAGDPRRVWTD